jgi:hypothetical protein
MRCIASPRCGATCSARLADRAPWMWAPRHARTSVRMHVAHDVRHTPLCGAGIRSSTGEAIRIRHRLLPFTPASARRVRLASDRHDRQRSPRAAPRTGPRGGNTGGRSLTRGTSRSQPCAMIKEFVCRNLSSTSLGLDPARGKREPASLVLFGATSSRERGLRHPHPRCRTQSVRGLGWKWLRHPQSAHG